MPEKQKYQMNLNGRRDFKNSPAKVRARNAAKKNADKVGKKPKVNTMRSAIDAGKKTQAGREASKQNSSSLLRIKPGSERKRTKKEGYKNQPVKPLGRKEGFDKK